jgi:hypothetical protein
MLYQEQSPQKGGQGFQRKKYGFIRLLDVTLKSSGLEKKEKLGIWVESSKIERH